MSKQAFKRKQNLEGNLIRIKLRLGQAKLVYKADITGRPTEAEGSIQLNPFSRVARFAKKSEKDFLDTKQLN